MVVGATGAIGAACAQPARPHRPGECTWYHRSPPSYWSWRKSILKESPGAGLVLASYADSDRSIGDMDMIVTATSGAGKKILDIMKVKPGCVITDVARPLDLPAGGGGEAPRRPGHRVRRGLPARVKSA